MRKTKKRFLSALLACAMIISLFPFAAFADVTANDADSLKAEIAAAKDGDTIEIPAGTYDIGTLTIENAVSLQGAGAGNTILNGKIQYAANATATEDKNSITIEGLTIKAAGTDNDKAIRWSYQADPTNNGALTDYTLNIKDCVIDGFDYGTSLDSKASGCKLNVESTTFENTSCAVSIKAGNTIESYTDVIQESGYATQYFNNGYITNGYYNDMNTYLEQQKNSGTAGSSYEPDVDVTEDSNQTVVFDSDGLEKAIADAKNDVMTTIIVAPGTYDGNITFGGKSLTIKAQYPAYENGVQTDDSKLSKFTGTFNTFNGTNDSDFKADQTIVIDGFALSGDGLKIGNMNYNGVDNLEVRHCTMEFGKNLTNANDNSYAGYNYFVKLSGNNGTPYASVIVEDNYVAGTPVTNVYPIQLWDVDNAVVRNNVIALEGAKDFDAISISKMSEKATVDVSGNTISGAGTAASITTWYLGGITNKDNAEQFEGTITVENNTLDCPVDGNRDLIFIGYKDEVGYGLLGGTINTSNNTNDGEAVEAVLGQKANSGVTMLTATFNYRNGEADQVITVAASDDKATITTLAAPTREGYTFKGWVANGERYNANASVTITADTTFTADWEPPYTGKYSYAINVANMDNGSVSVDKYATEGEKVTLTVSPDKAYKLDELTVTANGKDVELTDNGDGTYTFTMPSSNVKVSASFVEDEDYVEPDNSITVSMTIGSNDFVINNNIVTVPDAAPYIANDRTYVPFRALGEALGAKVVWDNDARTVTYTLGDTEIVMTIGDTTYTINGVEKSMDVAPEITGDRTYVPVRFVAEGLGFKVTPLYADNGTTASVVFEK